jgi:hypothetical protein
MPGLNRASKIHFSRALSLGLEHSERDKVHILFWALKSEMKRNKKNFCDFRAKCIDMMLVGQ